MTGMHTVRMRRNPGDTGHLKQVKTGLALGSEGSWRRRECVWGAAWVSVLNERQVVKWKCFSRRQKDVEREFRHLGNATSPRIKKKKKTKQIQINVPE